MPQKILRQTWSASLGPVPLATVIQCFGPVLLMRRHCGPRALLRWRIRVNHRRTAKKYFRPTMMKSYARTREMIPLPIRRVHHTKSTSDMAGSRRISAILVSVQPCFSLGRWRYGPAGEHRECYRRNHWTTYWDTRQVCDTHLLARHNMATYNQQYTGSRRWKKGFQLQR